MNTEVIITVVLVIVVLAVIAYFVYKKDKFIDLSSYSPEGAPINNRPSYSMNPGFPTAGFQEAPVSIATLKKWYPNESIATLIKQYPGAT